MAASNTDFLKDYVAKKTAQPKQSEKDADAQVNIKDALEDATSETPDIKAKIRQKRLHRKAATVDETIAKADEDLQRTQEEEALQEEELVRKRNESIREAARQKLIETADTAKGIADNVAAFPTTGGIALLITIIAVLLFTVVQVNAQGDTRLKQLWYMLNGRAQLQGKVQITPVIGGSASGNFAGANGAGNDTGGIDITSGNTVTPFSFGTYRTGIPI
jgi:hypothetical protein